MKIKDYIVNDFRPIALETTISKLFSTIHAYPFSHYIICENDKLLGLIAKEDLLSASNTEATVRDLSFDIQHFFTRLPDTLYELINVFAQHESNIIPLIDEENNYLGYFELNEILLLCSVTPFFKNDTTTLVVEKNNNDYSISELAQIIESNKLRLLGIFVSSITKDTTQITLRIDTENANEVIQSLRRYEYRVLSSNKDDFLLEQMKERADYLQKYLEI
jgi:Mg/Co/Ni transporter MgtE